MSNDAAPPLPGAPDCLTEQPIRFLTPAGELAEPSRAGDYTMPPLDDLVEMYRAMTVARRFDTQVTALTRQGRLATYPSALGQEACEIAAVHALRGDDWIFPTYRDSIALLTRGVPPASILSFFRGDWHMSFDSRDHSVAPQSTPLATQSLHAVGFATASKLKKDGLVSLAMLGDGATSEGDTHEALNFAAVWNAPVVFLVQNNQYAISTPTSLQFRSRTIASRAHGYDMPGVVVDGNDPAAMLAVLRDAVERARAGEGPTLVEGVTYRLESHTNSDDPTRYRDDAEREEWRERDPIARLEAYLVSQGALDDEAIAAVQAEAEALAAATRDVMNAEAEIDPLELFDFVYDNPRLALIEQREFLAAELAAHDAEEETR